MARKSCWTCKARRVRCDGSLPVCQKCIQAQRKCQGYEMRLSWPKDYDRKRAIMVEPLPAALNSGQGQRNEVFINTSWRDMEIYRYMSMQVQSLHVVQPTPSLWVLPQADANYSDLLQHFYNNAYLSLATFKLTNYQIRDMLMRLAAVAHDSVTGLALLHALLAFSSLHRNGSNQQAIRLKIAALQYLSAATRGRSLSSFEAIQHVAASMLLGSYELLLPSESSGEWLWYTWGAIDITQATSLESQSQENDIGPLLDWVYFNNALSRFSIYHWRHQSLFQKTTASVYSSPLQLQYPSLTRHRSPLPSQSPTHAIFKLLSDVCDKLLNASDPGSGNDDFQNALSVLEKKAESLFARLNSSKSGSEFELGAKVWHLATRVYLVRASQGQLEERIDLVSEVNELFASIVGICSCGHFFPMFILACEAGTDERRAAVIGLIDRTEKGARSRKTFVELRAMIQAIWVQQDLYADSDLLMNYLDTLSTIISRSPAPLSFV